MEEVKVYRCIKSFEVPRYDEDADEFIENQSIPVGAGTVWDVFFNGGRSCGGEVRLEKVNGETWIEISRGTLDEYFKDIQSED